MSSLNKKRIIKKLYENPPKGCPVICFDEFGPLEIRPYAGSCWAPVKKPQRLAATYTRYHGVRHLLAGYDLIQDKLFGIIRRKKRSKEFISFLKIIRRRYPNERRLIIILDNFSAHKKKEAFNWCRSNGVWLIFTATNASWMNRIEAQFGSVHYFVLKCSYPKNHAELEQNVKEHLKWRNSNRHNPLLKCLQKKTYVI
ncbi:MAG: IS630 family transposase [Actinobacteria bacterium]|nr:IS630 family transposase [Actinomycetota bacterium]